MNELNFLVAMKTYIEASEETIASLSGDDLPGIKREMAISMPPLYDEILRRIARAQSADIAASTIKENE